MAYSRGPALSKSNNVLQMTTRFFPPHTLASASTLFSDNKWPGQPSITKKRVKFPPQLSHSNPASKQVLGAQYPLLASPDASEANWWLNTCIQFASTNLDSHQLRNAKVEQPSKLVLSTRTNYSHFFTFFKPDYNTISLHFAKISLFHYVGTNL